MPHIRACRIPPGEQEGAIHRRGGLDVNEKRITDKAVDGPYFAAAVTVRMAFRESRSAVASAVSVITAVPAGYRRRRSDPASRPCDP